MEEEREIEYKSVVSKNKYGELLQSIGRFAEQQEVYEQENFYFDDENQTLGKLGVTLRVRLKKGKYELQAKLPQEAPGAKYSDQKELKEKLEEQRAKLLIEGGASSESEFLRNVAAALGVNVGNCFCLGSLVTKRADFVFYQDTISLDENQYNGITDYEIEWETTNHKFADFVNDQYLKVEFGNAKGKAKRFSQSLSK